jgi:transcriptional regulator with XRE-family HTH domain
MRAKTDGGTKPMANRGLKEELGARIVEARERRGWSQAELARRLGVSRERLGWWERGRSAPGVEGLVALSEMLRVPFEELLLGRRREGGQISSVELTVLARHAAAMARLLKQWAEPSQTVSGSPAPMTAPVGRRR